MLLRNMNVLILNFESDWCWIIIYGYFNVLCWDLVKVIVKNIKNIELYFSWCIGKLKSCLLVNGWGWILRWLGIYVIKIG